MRIGKMEFGQRLRRRVACAAAVLCMGLAIVLCSVLAGRLFRHDFTYFFLFGLGAGLSACGVVKLRQALLILRDPEKRRTARIEEEDERNRSMDTLSSHWTYSIGLIGLAVASIIAAFYNENLMHTLSTVLFLVIAVKCVTLLALRRMG